MATITATRQKHYGAFYTPELMAAALVDWALRSPVDTVLDPSFGGLVFLREADRRLRELGANAPQRHLFGADLDEHAFAEAAEIGPLGAKLVHRDFLRIDPDGGLLPRVTAVVGNPPYVRYQSFRDGRERGRAIAARHGVHLTRLASSWAPLLIHASDFVLPGGRLAQVLPAELIHSQYSHQVLDSICASFSRVIVAMFEEHVFPGAQEEVVLLFAEGHNQGPAPGVEIVSCTNLADLRIPPTLSTRLEVDAEHKLLAGLLEPGCLDAYDRLRNGPQTSRLGELASVDIGAVTGSNDFFVRSARAFSEVPQNWLRPAVSKAIHVPGARLPQADIVRMDAQDLPARMLVVDPDLDAPPPSVEKLISEGEQAGIHRRYKCRIRSPWWALPGRQVASAPDLFLTYMSSDVPRLCVNEAGALSTNTVHTVRLRNGGDCAGLAASFYSSLTMLSAELVGRSYGGGVLKLEPTEAERLILPRPSPGHAALLKKVDQLLRARHYDELQTTVDQAVLIDDLGIPAVDVAALRRGVARLRGRRRSRSTRRSR